MLADPAVAHQVGEDQHVRVLLAVPGEKPGDHRPTLDPPRVRLGAGRPARWPRVHHPQVAAVHARVREGQLERTTSRVGAVEPDDDLAAPGHLPQGGSALVVDRVPEAGHDDDGAPGPHGEEDRDLVARPGRGRAQPAVAEHQQVRAPRGSHQQGDGVAGDDAHAGAGGHGVDQRPSAGQCRRGAAREEVQRGHHDRPGGVGDHGDAVRDDVDEVEPALGGQRLRRPPAHRAVVRRAPVQGDDHGAERDRGAAHVEGPLVGGVARSGVGRGMPSTVQEAGEAPQGRRSLSRSAAIPCRSGSGSGSGSSSPAPARRSTAGPPGSGRRRGRTSRSPPAPRAASGTRR